VDPSIVEDPLFGCLRRVLRMLAPNVIGYILVAPSAGAPAADSHDTSVPRGHDQVHTNGQGGSAPDQ
jgi:hypothetical protein